MKRTRVTQWLLLSVVFLLSGINFTAHARMTVGDDQPPRPGAVLDLRATNPTGYVGGLLLPHVNITDLGYIPIDYTAVQNNQMGIPVAGKGIDKNSNLTGMVVYNTSVVTGLGIYYWDGDYWIQLTGCSCNGS